MTFRAAIRAATVELLEDFRDDSEIKFNIWPGRPRSVAPPHAFVDTIRETLDTTGMGVGLQQRRPQVDVVLLHGLFDSKDTVEQADAFVDGFIAWVKARYHAAGAATLIEIVGVEDLPTYVDEWVIPKEAQRTYFGTLITLEGYAES